MRCYTAEIPFDRNKGINEIPFDMNLTGIKEKSILYIGKRKTCKKSLIIPVKLELCSKKNHILLRKAGFVSALQHQVLRNFRGEGKPAINIEFLLSSWPKDLFREAVWFT